MNWDSRHGLGEQDEDLFSFSTRLDEAEHVSLRVFVLEVQVQTFGEAVSLQSVCPNRCRNIPRVLNQIPRRMRRF